MCPEGTITINSGWKGNQINSLIKQCPTSLLDYHVCIVNKIPVFDFLMSWLLWISQNCNIPTRYNNMVLRIHFYHCFVSSLSFLTRRWFYKKLLFFFFFSLKWFYVIIWSYLHLFHLLTVCEQIVTWCEKWDPGRSLMRFSCFTWSLKPV